MTHVNCHMTPFSILPFPSAVPSLKVTSVIPVDSYAREDEHLVLMTSQGKTSQPLHFPVLT
jgi:hypothetical protein